MSREKEELVHYVSRVYISLDDVEDRNITGRFAGSGGHHAVLGL
jgi:hypothetical protein